MGLACFIGFRLQGRHSPCLLTPPLTLAEVQTLGCGTGRFDSGSPQRHREMVLNLACLSQSSVPSHCGQLCQVLQPKNVMQAVNKKKSDTQTQHTYLTTNGSFVQVILLFSFILFFFLNYLLELHEKIYYNVEKEIQCCCICKCESRK